MGATSGGIKAGKAFVLIEALDKTKAGLQGVHQSLRQFGSEISAAGQNILMKSIGALIPVGLSERIYAEFDDSMRKVEARTTGTTAELSALRDEAKRLGRETAFTSSNIAELQNKLAQKGFERSEIFKMTEPITHLARAAGDGADMMQDVTTAASLTAGTLRQYSMGAEKAAYVTDLLTMAANASNFNLEELATSMSYVGPEAHEFGLSLEETLALLGGMRDLNIDASIAGTSLRNMFTFLSKGEHQEKFNKELQALTGNTIKFTDAAGNLQPLPDLLLAIGNATKGLGTGVRSDLYSDIFGTRVTVSAKAAAKQIETYNKMLFKLQAQSEGVAKKTHDKMEAGIGGIFRELLSSIEAVALSIGETLSPALAIGAVIIDRLSKMLSFWIMKNQRVVLSVVTIISAFALLGLGLTTLGIAISVVGSLIGTVITVLTFMSAVLGFVLSPIGLIVIAGTALVGVLILLAAHFEILNAAMFGFTGQAVSGIFESIIEGSKASIDFLGRLSKAFGKAVAAGDLKSASELVWAELIVLFTSSGNTLSDIWDGVVSHYESGVAAIRTVFIDMLKGIMSAMSIVLDAQKSVIESIKADPAWFEFTQGSLPQKNSLFSDESTERMKKIREALDPKSLDSSAFMEDFGKAELERTKARLQRELALAKSQAERDRILKEIEDAKEEKPEDINDILRTRLEGMGRRADALIEAGPPGGIIAPKANMGLERGSVEAAKQFQENMYNASTMLGVAKEHLGVAKEALDVGKKVEDALREIAGGEGV